MNDNGIGHDFGARSQILADEKLQISIANIQK